MKRTVQLSAVLIGALIVTVGFTATSRGVTPIANEKSTVRQLDVKWAQAMVHNDQAFLGSLYADGFVDTNPDGSISTKQQELGALKSGDLKISTADLSDVQVHLFGSTAVVVAHVELEGTARGEAMGGSFRYTDVFSKINGRWKAVASHASLLPKPG